MTGARVAAHPPRVQADATDTEAIVRVLAGERDAFELLVHRYQNSLYRYARGLGMEHDNAVDLVQDTFVKAYVRLAQCRDREKFLSWLFRIFRNTMLDWLKDIRRTEVSLADVVDPADPADFAERQSLRELLGGAMAALPPILREAFLLRHQLGHSYEEIADIAGISLSAAKMRVMRARDALHGTLAPQLDDVTGPVPHSS
jgi:RNA polymerase sigma-70 factor, ECF subfamily